MDIDKRNEAAAAELAAAVEEAQRKALDDTTPIRTGEPPPTRPALCLLCSDHHRIACAFVEPLVELPCEICGIRTVTRGYRGYGGAWVPKFDRDGHPVGFW